MIDFDFVLLLKFLGEPAEMCVDVDPLEVDIGAPIDEKFETRGDSLIVFYRGGYMSQKAGQQRGADQLLVELFAL